MMQKITDHHIFIYKLPNTFQNFEWSSKIQKIFKIKVFYFQKLHLLTKIRCFITIFALFYIHTSIDKPFSWTWSKYDSNCLIGVLNVYVRTDKGDFSTQGKKKVCFENIRFLETLQNFAASGTFLKTNSLFKDQGKYPYLSIRSLKISLFLFP